MKARGAQRLTLSGFGAAISVLSIIMSFYMRPLALAFRLITMMGLMLPLTKGYFREAFLAYVAIISMGVIFINFKIIGFALIGGLYTIISTYIEKNPLKINWYIGLLIKIGYATVLYWALFGFVNFFVFEIVQLGYIWNPAATYIFFNLLFVAIFLLYDKLLIASFNYFAKIINRISVYYF